MLSKQIKRAAIFHSFSTGIGSRNQIEKYIWLGHLYSAIMLVPNQVSRSCNPYRKRVKVAPGDRPTPGLEVATIFVILLTFLILFIRIIWGIVVDVTILFELCGQQLWWFNSDIFWKRSLVLKFFSDGRWEKISWSQRRRWWWHERGRRRLLAPRWGQERSSEFYHHFHFLDRSSEFHKGFFSDAFIIPSLSLSR